MSEDDIKKALDLINAHYKLPSPPELPETLSVKYRFRRSAKFNRNGIHLLVSGQPHEYLWGAMRRVHIVRMDPLRRDFLSLTIVLPDQEIEFRLFSHQGRTLPTWSGATAEEVNEFLAQYVPNKQIDVDIYGEPPAKRTDIEKQLAKAMKKRREFRIMLYGSAFLLAAWMVWAAIARNVVFAIVMGAMIAVFLGPILWCLQRLLRKRCLELEAMVAASDGDGAASPPCRPGKNA